jgi:hypothetical protein
MKIYAYRVESDGGTKLEDVLAKLYSLPLADRSIGPGRILRLEKMATSQSSSRIYLDFAKSRSGHGPGKISKSTNMESISLGDGEEFAEDTAILYDCNTAYAAVQFNAHGPRVARIGQYLSAAEIKFRFVKSEQKHGFYFSAVLLDDAYDRLKRTGIVKSLEFDVALPGVDAKDLQSGASLQQVLKAPFPTGSTRISVTVHAAAKRDSALGHSGVISWVNEALKMGDLLSKLRVRGKLDGARPIKIDLLEEIIMTEVPLKLDPGKRFGRKDRWNALREVMDTWYSEKRLKQ